VAFFSTLLEISDGEERMWRTKAVNRQKAEDLTTQVVFGAIAAEFPAGPSGNALRRSACFWLTCGSRKWRN